MAHYAVKVYATPLGGLGSGRGAPSAVRMLPFGGGGSGRGAPSAVRTVPLGGGGSGRGAPSATKTLGGGGSGKGAPSATIGLLTLYLPPLNEGSTINKARETKIDRIASFLTDESLLETHDEGFPRNESPKLKNVLISEQQGLCQR